MASKSAIIVRIQPHKPRNFFDYFVVTKANFRRKQEAARKNDLRHESKK